MTEKLIEEGKSGKEEGEGSKLPPRKELENKLVEEGVKIIGGLINLLKSGRDKVDEDIDEAVSWVIKRCKVVTRDDIDVIEKMAQVARERVDTLEKRVEELEKKVEGKEKED